MLLWLILCAAVGFLLLISGALTDLRDLWSHPEHRFDEDETLAEKRRHKSSHAQSSGRR